MAVRRPPALLLALESESPHLVTARGCRAAHRLYWRGLPPRSAAWHHPTLRFRPSPDLPSLAAALAVWLRHIDCLSRCRKPISSYSRHRAVWAAFLIPSNAEAS